MKGKRDGNRRIFCSFFTTSLGVGGVVAGDEGLLEVFLPFGGASRDETAEAVGRLHPAAVTENPLTRKAARLLSRYFAGKPVLFDLPLDGSGFTQFQTVVHAEVQRIPAGTTVSYGEIARRVGRPKAGRAVGRVMARNPLPIIIPCHRVVAADGELTGYSGCGGIDSKRWLLEMEKRVSGAAIG